MPARSLDFSSALRSMCHLDYFTQSTHSHHLSPSLTWKRTLEHLRDWTQDTEPPTDQRQKPTSPDPEPRAACRSPLPAGQLPPTSVHLPGPTVSKAASGFLLCTRVKKVGSRNGTFLNPANKDGCDAKTAISSAAPEPGPLPERRGGGRSAPALRTARRLDTGKQRGTYLTVCALLRGPTQLFFAECSASSLFL